MPTAQRSLAREGAAFTVWLLAAPHCPFTGDTVANAVRFANSYTFELAVSATQPLPAWSTEIQLRFRFVRPRAAVSTSAGGEPGGTL